MNNLCNALWNYWDAPKPKVRLGKQEPVKVSNGEALFFIVKFVVLAIAISFLVFMMWVVL